MGVAQLVQLCIRLDHSRGDPGASFWILRPGAGALGHDVSEAGVERNGERPAAHGPLQASRNVESVREEHRPWIGRPPQNGLLVVIPGKDAVAVGVHEARYVEIGARGEQAIRIRERALDRRKAIVGAKPGNHEQIL